MKILKKLGVIFAGIAFCLSLTVATSYAQPGRAGWKNNNGKSKGWYKGQRNGWDNGRKTGWRNRSAILTQQNRSWQNRNRQNVYWQQNRRLRNGRITTQEYLQLQRKRAQLYRTRSRYYNDGYLSDKERRKLNKRYNKYQQRVRRDRRDW
jgi:hypothetical protein